MGTVYVDNLEPQSGTTLTLGASGDTIALASGATAGFGRVLQVLTNEYTTITTTSSSSFTKIGPAVTITPTASNTKMLVTVLGGSVYTATDKNAQWTIYRDISGGSSTNLGGSAGLMNHFANSSFLQQPVAMHVLDTHGTTSNIEYATYVRTTTGSGIDVQANATKTIMTVMEIGA